MHDPNWKVSIVRAMVEARRDNRCVEVEIDPSDIESALAWRAEIEAKWRHTHVHFSLANGSVIAIPTPSIEGSLCDAVAIALATGRKVRLYHCEDVRGRAVKLGLTADSDWVMGQGCMIALTV